MEIQKEKVMVQSPTATWWQRPGRALISSQTLHIEAMPPILLWACGTVTGPVLSMGMALMDLSQALPGSRRWLWCWQSAQGCPEGWSPPLETPVPLIHVLSLFAQSCPTLCHPVVCSPSGTSAHGDSPCRNTVVGCHALLQAIVPTQGSNPGLPHCRQILYHLRHEGSPTNSSTSISGALCVWFVICGSCKCRREIITPFQHSPEIILSELWTVINPDGTEGSNTRGFRLCIRRVTWLRMYYSLGICDAMQRHAGWDFSRMRRRLFQ